MNRILERLGNPAAAIAPEKQGGFLRMILLLLTGYVLGAAAAGGIYAGNRERFEGVAEAAGNLYRAPDFSRIFLRSLTTDAVYYLLCVAGGLFAFGMAVIWFVVLFRGLGCGMTAGALCISFGLNGFIFYLLAILPGLFISLLAFGYAASGCRDFALLHFNSFFGFGKRALFTPPKPWGSVLVCALFSLFAAVIAAAMSGLFYKLLL